MADGLADADRTFLEDTRIGVLVSSRADGSALGVPVWFDWDGHAVRMFSAADAPKTRRLQRRPAVSLLVTNRVGEPERWVAFDGEVKIAGEGGLALAERLAARYWDPMDAAAAETLSTWRQHPEALCLLTLVPDRIRTGR